MKKWQCRWSPTLGALEGTHQEAWGTDDYTDQERPTVFFGLYGLPDFYALWRHKGEKHILWAGSDIRHFSAGYWLDGKGVIKLNPWPLAFWIAENCTSWVENNVEWEALAKLGIDANIVPSFLGNVRDFPLRKKNKNRKWYSSVSGDDFKLYHWRRIDDFAKNYPQAEFHLYGNITLWRPKYKNVIVHGRVPKEKMNKEIADMQGAIRLVEFEGFSEIVAKAVLSGQDVISEIEYPSGWLTRKGLLKVLNKYPWNTKK